MNINIDIEKLVLEGMSISASQGRKLQGLVEAELARLLATEGIPDNWTSGGVCIMAIGRGQRRFLYRKISIRARILWLTLPLARWAIAAKLQIT